MFNTRLDLDAVDLEVLQRTALVLTPTLSDTRYDLHPAR